MLHSKRFQIGAFSLLIGLLLSSRRAAAEAIPNGTGSANAVLMNDGWRLWLDTSAPWKNDRLYLPDEVILKDMPTNPPTGGWPTLSDSAGIAVTLPDTVERHFWGQKPLPTAASDKPSAVVSLNSPYQGVSWWYRSFTPPVMQPAERLVFSFPGVRLRAEVYVNGILVGYNLIGETPFTADATSAVQPGKANQLAVRITNPGGTFSWPDYGELRWGNYQLPMTHGFGGMDAGVTMAVHARVAVEDLFVANTPDVHTVTLQAQVVSTGPAYQGPVRFTITRGNDTVWTGSADVNVDANGQATATAQANVPAAEVWDLSHPNLYRAHANIESQPDSQRVTDFGFRWFNAVGFGSDPHLELNGRRIFISSAISWGYWAPNGLFPDASAVQREIDAVHTFNMNCIQTHRHFPKAAVLTGFDHAGLLRYCEPGGGGFAWTQPADYKHPTGPVDDSGNGGEPTSFVNRYEMAKILAMVKAYRSHPAVILWSMCNESSDDVHNPKKFNLMRKIHELDPSRIVVLKSGFGEQGQIMDRPYEPNPYYGDKATGHDSGWHDIHNEGDAGVYQDSLYKGPTDFKTYTDDTRGISMFGELGTANSPDDETSIVKWYQGHHTTGYDLAASQARLTAYDRFLDKYQFRSAFPTAEDLFRAIGARHYFAAAHIIENARIANANDYIAITGWESTTVDNNSGIVDATRALKSDPFLIRQANSPELLVLRARHYVLAQGEEAVVDAFAVNQTNRHGDFTLHFNAAADSSKEKPFFDASFPVTLQGGQVFGQLLKDNIRFTVPVAGPVTMTAWLTGGDAAPQLQRTEPLYVVNPNPAPLAGSIACTDANGRLMPALEKQFGIKATELASAPAKIDVILASSAGDHQSMLDLTNIQREDHVENTDDPGLFSEQATCKAGDLVWYKHLAPGAATVKLYFVETYFDKPDIRLFDIALNGKTVATKFDIYKEAGGKDKGLVSTFAANCPDGQLLVSIPKVESDHPEIAAIQIIGASGKVIREVFRPNDYRSVSGQLWSAVHPGDFDWAKLFASTLDRVRAGTRLVLLGGDVRDLGDAARLLAQQHILSYGGLAGYDDTAWLGHWYFCKSHWLLDGLPTNCALDWQYQAAAGGDALVLDAPGLDAVVGYGKNSGPGLGVAVAVIPCGKGQIVMLGINGLANSFLNADRNTFQPTVAARILYNSLRRPPSDFN